MIKVTPLLTPLHGKCSFLLLNADEVCLRDLVGRPADCRAGSRRQNSGVHSPEETLRSFPSVDDPSSVPETAGIANLSVRVGAPRLEQSLYDVQRSRGGGCNTSGKATSCAVSEGVVSSLSAVLHSLCQGLVCGELKCGERNGHGESRRVRGVEGTDAFSAVNCARTFSDIAEG
jgi:hypothetical protein